MMVLVFTHFLPKNNSNSLEERSALNDFFETGNETILSQIVEHIFPIPEHFEATLKEQIESLIQPELVSSSHSLFM